MLEKDKQLLLKDICARLPYGVKCYYNSLEIYDDLQEGVSIIKGFQNNGILVEIESGDIIDIEDVKPYLRPLSSMTEDERVEYLICCDADSQDMLNHPHYRGTDWLNVHHFDYRNLIEKGLALEAPEGMYN